MEHVIDTGVYLPAKSGLADVATPLYALTQKGCGWDWSEVYEGSYQRLCLTLAQSPVTLTHPDWKKHFYLEVDASDYAVGGVLAQEDTEGRLKFKSHFSHRLLTMLRGSITLLEIKVTRGERNS